MKKLVDLLKEVNEGFKTKKASDGYRKNDTSDSEGKYRKTKIGGSLPKDWQDREPGVDFIPNQEILDDREAYEKGQRDRRARGVSHKPKKTKLGRKWDFKDYVLFPAKSEVFLDKKEEVLSSLRDTMDRAIKHLDSSNKYEPLKPEELEKSLSSLTMDRAGNVHYNGPYDLSYKRIGRPFLAIKGDELCDINPDSMGKVRKTQIFPKHLINQKQLQNRLPKPEEGEENAED